MQNEEKKGTTESNSTVLKTLTYTGPVPKPHPPCTDPTPDEQYRQYTEQKMQELQQRQEQQRAMEGAPADSNNNNNNNFGSMISNAAVNFRTLAQQMAFKVERASTEVTNVTANRVRQLDRQLSLDRFKNNFPELSAMGEVLLADYSCAAMHAGVRVNGHMHITKNYLCFSAQTTSTLAKATSTVLREAGLPAGTESSTDIRQVIPLTEIASIQLSVALDTVDQGPPFFLPIPAPNVLPTSLQLYTTRQQLFQFLDFESVVAKAGAVLSDAVKGRPIDRAYNYLDHAWRDATNVPLPGVTYVS
ncbi:GRAM domain [Trypanosoma melophagium]|uniref:GRAM domain n=1 Tax=Trypanosoma melophagium TaxID=715481 RepID=UPI00351A49FE|nr:GRAM domain [Trypanosoma melophagium]